jgi:ABC-type polysaccharide/polyol phosphate transport system ATPase subunit
MSASGPMRALAYECRLRKFIDAASILVLATHDKGLMKKMCDRTFDLGIREFNGL